MIILIYNSFSKNGCFEKEGRQGENGFTKAPELSLDEK
jgi:hypothetical protein